MALLGRHGRTVVELCLIIIFTTSPVLGPFFGAHFWGPDAPAMMNEKMRMRMRMVMMKYDVWPGKGDGEEESGEERRGGKGRMRESVFS